MAWSCSTPAPLSRAGALAARPLRLPVAAREEREGKLYITVRFARPRWQQWLGAEATCTRTFGLDPYGREVYESCDGEATVEAIVRAFARRHRLDLAEAEAAVTAFLHTLVRKGLVAVAVESPSARSRAGQRR